MPDNTNYQALSGRRVELELAQQRRSERGTKQEPRAPQTPTVLGQRLEFFAYINARLKLRNPEVR